MLPTICDRPKSWFSARGGGSMVSEDHRNPEVEVPHFDTYFTTFLTLFSLFDLFFTLFYPLRHSFHPVVKYFFDNFSVTLRSNVKVTNLCYTRPA